MTKPLTRGQKMANRWKRQTKAVAAKVGVHSHGRLQMYRLMIIYIKKEIRAEQAAIKEQEEALNRQ